MRVIAPWIHLAAFLLGSTFLGCHPEPSAFKAGGLYSVRDGKELFKVAKVLVVDKDMVHVRLYKNKFSTRPSTLEPSELSMGSVKDPVGFGIGHLPLDTQTFIGWDPVFLAETAVTDKELEGYRIWKENGGGAFK
jgi:hypothetical protein